jgi:glutaminyl-tRNA synthetase
LKNAQIEDKFQFQRLGYFTVDKDSVAESLVFNRTVGLKDAWEEKGKKEENSLNNSLKEINKFFKVDSDSERKEVENVIMESIQAVTNFSLLQNVLKKNIANNKSSLLFANFMLKHSSQIAPKDFDEETIQKLYTMSLRSESAFVRIEAIQNLRKDVVSLQALSSFLENLKTTEKDKKVKELLFSI